MVRKKHEPPSTEQLAFYVPGFEATAIREVAKARGLTVSQWLREAAQWNLVREGRRAAPAEEEAYIRAVFRDVFAGVNFAAIAAEACLLMMRQWILDQLIAGDDLPAALAQEKVTLMVDDAMAQATTLFTDPSIQQLFSWHHQDPEALPGIFRMQPTEDDDEEA